MLASAAAAVTAVVTAATAAWAVRGRSSTWVAPSIWHGPRDRPVVALTFDDGPSASTSALLELLDRFGVKATFFQCGHNAERLPDAARAVSRAGHQVGNHTYSHARLWLRSAAFVESEVGRGQAVLAAIHGAPPEWFRAPYGVRWPGLGAAQRRHRLQGAMWTTIGGDWRLPAAAVERRLLRGAANGAIFCLHDGRELASSPDIRNTTEAVGNVIPRLLNLGFRFATLSQLAACPNSNSSSSPSTLSSSGA